MKNFTTLLVIALLGVSTHAFARFPSKAIQLVVGYPAGGNTDIVARALAHETSKISGWKVIVVNKSGAAGALSVMDVAAAPPDGYTVGIVISSTMTAAPFLQDIPPNLLERTTPLVWLGHAQQAIAVRSDSPIHTFKDLIEQGKAASIGTPGAGSGQSLALQAIRMDKKTKYVLVPYLGEAPAITALLGGHISAVACSEFALEPYVASGKMRIIASMDQYRLQYSPKIPTLIEQGFPYNVNATFYLYGPKGLPATLVKRIANVFGKAAHATAYLDATKKNLVTSHPISLKALEHSLREQRANTGKLIKRLGIKKY